MQADRIFFASLLYRKKTTEKLCSLLMSKACISDDLPPNELPNPKPETYLSDLISIQDLLLAGKVSKSMIVSFIAKRSNRASVEESYLAVSDDGCVSGRRRYLPFCLFAVCDAALPRK